MFLLLKVKEKSEKSGLKLNIKEKEKHETKIMAFGHITSWHKEGPIITLHRIFPSICFLVAMSFISSSVNVSVLIMSIYRHAAQVRLNR